MAKWIDLLFSINKEAEQTDAQQEFQKKAKKSAWVEGVMGINEQTLAKEVDAKIEAELKVRDEITKEAAYEAFQTTEEVLKQDYSRDVRILSDYALAEMIAEIRGHNNQDFMENASEYKEKAKKDIKSDRKAVEKELLDNVGLSAQVDWKKSFEKYTKDGKPTEPKENKLYEPKLEKVDDQLSEGGKEKEYSQTDEEHAKTMLGIGREEKERVDVIAQPGEVHKDASLVRDPDTELRVGGLIRLARSVMTHEGIILAEGTNWEILSSDGNHYIIGANGQKHVISSHDSPKFDTIQKNASQEITNHATKEQVIAKIAEIKSPWCVVEKDGQEVIARIEDSKNTKESEEEKKDLSK
jgi:hypothetical protein